MHDYNINGDLDWQMYDSVFSFDATKNKVFFFNSVFEMRQKKARSIFFSTNESKIKWLLQNDTFWATAVIRLYDNEYASIIDIYFYECFLPFKSWALALQNIWGSLSDILDKRLCFPLIKIEPVSINPCQAALSLLSFSVVYIFY